MSHPQYTMTREKSSKVQVEWITDTRRMTELAEEWTSLEPSIQHRTVFSTFDFLRSWYSNHVLYGGNPLIGVARRDGALAGIAPLVMRRGCLARIPLNRVQFAMHDAYSGEFLVEDNHPETVGAFIDSLAGSVAFDLMCLNGIEPGTSQFSVLEDAAARNGLRMELTNHPNATVDLRGGYDAYCRSMSRNFRRTVKRQAQRVMSEGRPTVGGVRLNSGKDSVDSCIERLFTVMESSYKLKGKRIPDCHRNHLAELARRFAARNSLHLSILSIGDKDAAAVMGLVERGTYYDFTLAYSEQFAPLSPGAYLMQEVLSDLAERGVHTVVSHGAHEYKLRWSTAFVPSTRVFLFARTNSARVSRFVRFTTAPLWRKLGVGEP
jgi:CelD/BcsL family acetyltransferase involved in cellulose biosynthesis